MSQQYQWHNEDPSRARTYRRETNAAASGSVYSSQDDGEPDEQGQGNVGTGYMQHAGGYYQTRSEDQQQTTRGPAPAHQGQYYAARPSSGHGPSSDGNQFVDPFQLLRGHRPGRSDEGAPATWQANPRHILSQAYPSSPAQQQLASPRMATSTAPPQSPYYGHHPREYLSSPQPVHQQSHAVSTGGPSRMSSTQGPLLTPGLYVPMIQPRGTTPVPSSPYGWGTTTPYASTTGGQNELSGRVPGVYPNRGRGGLGATPAALDPLRSLNPADYTRLRRNAQRRANRVERDLTTINPVATAGIASYRQFLREQTQEQNAGGQGDARPGSPRREARPGEPAYSQQEHAWRRAQRHLAPGADSYREFLREEGPRKRGRR